MQIIKRDNTRVGFDPSKIYNALEKAFVSQYGASVHMDRVNAVYETVLLQLETAHTPESAMHIEQVQNHVEQGLMKAGEIVVAKAYILYRHARAQERLTGKELSLSDGSTLRRQDLSDQVLRACSGIDHVDPMLILDRVFEELFDGATPEQVDEALMMATEPMIEVHPEYSRVAARLLMNKLRAEVLGARNMDAGQVASAYRTYFPNMIRAGIEANRYSGKLNDGRFMLNMLAAALKPERDEGFDILALQTLYDRYFVHLGGRRLEMPQSFFMRVAMGLALREKDPTLKAIEFYEVLSQKNFMNSTPTLFNSGCKHAQMSSCYLTTVADSLQGIYGSIRDNALLSKFAGGIGNDWTGVRAMGSYIQGTNGESQGIVPFLKVANDTAVAVNQGGKRKGAVCAYLETWHMDIEEFLDLRKNTGDDRRRTHDMNTANWIPDLFMERVLTKGDWTLFSPEEVPGLHDAYGSEFRALYGKYEAKAARGEMKLTKTVPALTLWRKMLTMLFETGHPWLTFKDPSNIRSPQRHDGVVHSSNLCTEITLNTKPSKYDEYGNCTEVGEVAVCNLGSINAAEHIDAQGNLLLDKLRKTVRTAMRMLDNVIDVNFYPTAEAKAANERHRPVALGVMGMQEVLYARRQSYSSPEAVTTNAEVMEAIAYFAYDASADLAQERGSYSTFVGSDWSKGIVPMDTIVRLRLTRAKEFADDLYMPDHNKLNMDWDALRVKVKQGMRNSNCMAIAPTATIGNIVGVTACVEPTYENCFVKSNMSGEFVVFNKWLINDLRALGLWDAEMMRDLKAADGSVQGIERVPADLKALYVTAFETDPLNIIECAVARGAHIDQSQSLNIYVKGASGKVLDTIYKRAWLRGLKTTYYLRSIGATSAEKSTGGASQLNAVKNDAAPEPDAPACFMRPGDPGFSDCEACQ